MAQRILKVKNHVLAIGKTQYPLEVTPHASELSPNEVLRGCGSPSCSHTDSVPGRQLEKGDLTLFFHLNYT